MMMHRVYIGLGSNTPDATKQMSDAIDWLMTQLDEVASSDVYSTPPLSGIGPDYLNAVATGLTAMSNDQLNLLLKDYERQAGRTPQSKISGQVPIDLDIVVWDGTVMREKDFSYDFFQRGYRQVIAEMKAERRDAER
ncbi:MAG: 2-amino-4-hydroxy-6-hydroxymethyldihydropteridine diphosphokinase [Muribaculaceae bacterium]|nr:2-amino-4-hydroxy-6-hydroxymethyldihydropteridine diphosphokinase [Muribaculaceae bacterium]MBQ2400200.1 2-amino-4-hydroxy-6-hydroxymethyldihydropteridine diphosphokinase [Muribaculaceae bacterium]MBQ5723148.1 2-amino-4-hydroxy-6-hydroxymethyldihydropteridine diphosphokinase [Muribaculaceae bacterium]MBR5787285.1 2-amino-4-hydroxy-6-hydroxymethyldihydropteridine diphosphokinase [Muribaculaceae bacterium]